MKLELCQFGKFREVFLYHCIRFRKKWIYFWVIMVDFVLNKKAPTKSYSELSQISSADLIFFLENSFCLGIFAKKLTWSSTSCMILSYTYRYLIRIEQRNCFREALLAKNWKSLSLSLSIKPFFITSACNIFKNSIRVSKKYRL